MHDGDGAHVADEIVVAKGSSSVGEDDFFLAAGKELVDDVFHLEGREKLPFFHIDGGRALPSCNNEVGLAAEKGGDLDDVADGAGDGGFFGGVDVGEDGEVEFALDAGEDFESFIHARSAEGVDRRAVGFVVGGFENELKRVAAKDLFQLFGCTESELLRFNNARAANDCKRMLFSNDEILDGHFLHKGP